MLKSKKIKIDKIEYVIKELTPRLLLPIMKGENSEDVGIEMAKLSVHVNKKPIGDALLDVGFSVFSKLVNTVNEVNGMSEGKD